MSSQVHMHMYVCMKVLYIAFMTCCMVYIRHSSLVTLETRQARNVNTKIIWLPFLFFFTPPPPQSPPRYVHVAHTQTISLFPFSLPSITIFSPLFSLASTSCVVTSLTAMHARQLLYLKREHTQNAFFQH